MTLTIDNPIRTDPRPSGGAGVRLVRAGDALWRVTGPTGTVIGHLQAVELHGDVRYRARRYHPATKAFRDLGDFWSADDAIDCLRFAR